MSRTENAELTVLCLIEDGDKILLQNRVKKDWQGYALPGGHVEPGESFVTLYEGLSVAVSTHSAGPHHEWSIEPFPTW